MTPPARQEDTEREWRRRLADLTPEQRALLLEKVRARQLAEHAPYSPILPAAREQPLLLSFAQQRLWFLDQLTENRGLYTISTAMRLTGMLDVSVFQRSLNEVVHRHEVFRTAFPRHVAHQVIAAASDVCLRQEDLSGESDPLAAGLRRAAEDARLPFNLTQGSLLRVTLLRLTPSDHLLLLSMHHIIADGWSMGVLLREVGTL